METSASLKQAESDHHWAFTDEKGHGRERYWGIGVASGPASALAAIRNELRSALGTLKYLEWKNITGDGARQRAALNFIQTAVSAACRGDLRIDVLMWDTQDSRHAIPGRDDIESVARMYHHVLTHCGRTTAQSRWSLYPDKGSSLDWGQIALYIRRTRVTRRKPYLLTLFGENRNHFEILEVEEQESSAEPLLQLADIFVGMGCFSVDRSEHLKLWMQTQKNRNQSALWSDLEPEAFAGSRSEEARFRLIAELKRLCDGGRLGVNLDKKGHLWTPRPRAPVNFWLYEVQHEGDRAPTRKAVRPAKN